MLRGTFPTSLDASVVARLNRLKRDELQYLVGALYALLMPSKRRQRLSAYFTPPAISNRVVEQLIDFGFNPLSSTIIDPACGGAAFLAPFARAIEDTLSKTRPAENAINMLHRIVGLEIEPGLAALSETLIADTLNVNGHNVEGKVVQRVNALRPGLIEDGSFDVVVSNPPYGRVFRAKRATVDRWSDVITDGHVNTYALFVALSIKLAKPSGLIALILPTSFIGGPYFANLRKYIRKETNILRLELIQKRSEAFLDVIQDTCVMYLRRRAEVGQVDNCPPVVAELAPDGSFRALGTMQLSPNPTGVWALPTPEFEYDWRGISYFDPRFSNLEDYGYLVKTGFFVWNRNGDKLASRIEPNVGEVPLIWAENVRANEHIQLGERKSTTANGRFSFVRVDPESSAIIRGPSLVVQRTTNRRQARRLIVGQVDERVPAIYGGYVTENHTIIIIGNPRAEHVLAIDTLMHLLNSRTVDSMYRKISGTVSVSTKLLRVLPLPKAEHLLMALAEGGDFEKAVTDAYDRTLGFKA
ncbi:SAM-dependent methyltransferase [Mesorhizobium sp. M0999]|uniref:HsdM family class I SAM-dependent methyltransferase n=1 Tax=Mesorhizobium sp. M0999 TaxID=2957045 RepID=UPI00333AA4D2